ncbi:MAG: phage holin family protein [Chloroflexota bacterium]|nr:MAG: phage holin family protein [Chloroflexota bacterium]
MRSILRFIRMILRFLLVWFVDTISLLITSWVISGVNLLPEQGFPVFVVATAAALMLSIVNLLIRPLILLLAVPLGWVFIFLAGFIMNGIVLLITSALLPGLEVSGLWAAFLGGLFLSFVNTVLITLLDIDDSESFYANLVKRQAAKQSELKEGENTRGVVMLEIDGLSYWHIKKAVEDGFMPTIKKLMDEQGFQISRVDCGLPATTPACQAGILQGNNTGIPAFRWLDKESNRLLAGGQAAAEIEPELSSGKGLLEGGSSIGNMFSGDATKSILTFSKIRAETPEDKKKRAQDMYLLMRNPYFFRRVVVLFFADMAQEVWQGWQQRRKDVQPRLNRLHNGDPLLRAATNIFLRDVGAYLTILDIIRGVPAIYTLFAGYDEVAHHSGPWTNDAMLTLQQFDRTIAQILMAAERDAPRPYEFILLSDHGQSFGATFEQRYEIGILDFIKEQLPHGTSAVSTGGGDDGTIGVSALMAELENLEDNRLAGAVGRSVLQQTRKSMKNNLEQQPGAKEVDPAKVTLCYSGNLAQVYFDLFPRKVTLNELNAAYPGMVDTLVQHEGIGIVVAYEDDLEAVAFGKNGARNLHTGDVVGEDPLEPFGDVELRAWQLRRIADFSNAGDLILNSTLYPDGTVAALEELIGSHGGLGGEQTDAFIFHPADMEIPETRNSQEVMSILKSRVGLPGPTPLPDLPAEIEAEPWEFAVLAKGLSQVRKWLGYAFEAIKLNKDTYGQIARDIYMTGPALLIAFLGQVLQSVNDQKQFVILDIFLRFGIWFIAVLFIQFAARLLRGKARYSETLRVAGFAQSAFILEVLGFLPVIGPLGRFMALLLNFFGVWIGASAAHQLKGWRTFILPIIYVLTLVIAVFFLFAVIEGSALTVGGLLQDFGIASGQ